MNLIVLDGIGPYLFPIDIGMLVVFELLTLFVEIPIIVITSEAFERKLKSWELAILVFVTNIVSLIFGIVMVYLGGGRW